MVVNLNSETSEYNLNKSIYNKKYNIFTFYNLNGDPLPVDHVILNSRSVCLKIKNELDGLVNSPMKNMNTTSFDYEVQNTGVKVKRELPLFDSLSIDLFEAFRMFRNIISLTKWSKMDTLNVFKSLCTDKILDYVKSDDDIEIVFTKILKHKYPENLNIRYNRYLQNLKLKNFQTIEQFKYAIDETIKRISIHKNYSKKEILRITNETFINGIDEKVLLKIIADGITEPEKIFERINEVEKFILSRTNTNIHKEKFPVQKINSKYNKKWCKFHQSKTHNDDECLVQKNSKNKINNIKNYLLPFIYAKSPLSRNIKILIESGASSSFINANLIEEKLKKI
ncbi:hypothetical protein DMUE_2327 [Dictyocoela muelleri]|nr:hypothetical protein DMUE_2327 [Dictyocoela muelleri]